MDDALDYNFPSIIRLLDIATIGPYLVKHSILTVEEYYNDYQSQMINNISHNAKLLPKLATKLKKQPQKFLDALEDCAKLEQHDGHWDLLKLLQGYIQNSHQVHLQVMKHRRRYESHRSTVQKRHQHDRRRGQHLAITAASTPVNHHELYVLESVSTTSQEENINATDAVHTSRGMVSALTENEMFKLERLHSKQSRKLSQPRSELVYGGYSGGRRQSAIINGPYKRESDSFSSSSDSNHEVFGSTELPQPPNHPEKSTASIATAEASIELKQFEVMETSQQNNSEMNVYDSQSHFECQERYKQLRLVVNEMELTFKTKIEELQNSLQVHKTEMEQLNKQMYSYSKQKSDCHVIIPKQTICYCYAQIGAHSHYIAENYHKQ